MDKIKRIIQANWLVDNPDIDSTGAAGRRGRQKIAHPGLFFLFERDHFLVDPFLREGAPPQTIPTRVTITTRMARPMIPVMSVVVTTGVGVGAGVSMAVAEVPGLGTGVASGARIELSSVGEGVGPGFSVGRAAERIAA